MARRTRMQLRPDRCLRQARRVGLDSLTGLRLTYVYFQVPVMVILVTPTLQGLLPQWREAAENLGGVGVGKWMP